MASWAGMRHEGSWWDDTDVEPCPNSPDIYSCWKNRQIGHDKAYFAEWAARVFAAAKERKTGNAIGASAGERQRDATIGKCSNIPNGLQMSLKIGELERLL
ncbi:hypothetical protein EJB05_43386, partial [Eragrostis curvula]